MQEAIHVLRRELCPDQRPQIARPVRHEMGVQVVHGRSQRSHFDALHRRPLCELACPAPSRPVGFLGDVEPLQRGRQDQGGEMGGRECGDAGKGRRDLPQ